MYIRKTDHGAGSTYSAIHPAACPYGPTINDFCSVSVMAVNVTNYLKNNYCSSDDFDRCPFFLARVLRKA